MSLSRRAALVTCLAGLSGVARGQGAVVQVQQPWARATAASARAGGAFMVLSTTAPDTVVSASSPVAEVVELHRTVNEAGVMRMLPAPDLALEPGKPVELKPGGLHVMLMGLKGPLRRGESFPLTLQFRHAPPVTVQVQIGGPGAAGPGS